MDYVADRVKCIDASAIRRIWQMAATMTDPVNFSIGEPDFGPPEEAKKAAAEAIMAGKNGYTLTAGIPELRNAISDQLSQEFGWEKPSVLVTCGLSGGLTLAFMATVNPGDELLIPDPYFVSYRHLVNMLGGKCAFVDTYPDFRLNPEKFEEKVTPKTKILVLNSPGNPSGVVYTPTELKAIAEFARKHKLLVISDEIYREFSYDQTAESIAKWYENTIVLRGFSKTFGVPGWRMAYMAMPPQLQPIMDQATSLQQYTFVCAPHPFQVAIAKSLNCDMSAQIQNYRMKRDAIFNGLKGAFPLQKPAGAFYAFVPAPGGNATQFVSEAIKNNVLIIPGSVFSQRDSHFRISYATVDQQITKGIDRLCQLATSKAWS